MKNSVIWFPEGELKSYHSEHKKDVFQPSFVRQLLTCVAVVLGHILKELTVSFSWEDGLRFSYPTNRNCLFSYIAPKQVCKDYFSFCKRFKRSTKPFHSNHNVSERISSHKRHFFHQPLVESNHADS